MNDQWIKWLKETYPFWAVLYALLSALFGIPRHWRDSDDNRGDKTSKLFRAIRVGQTAVAILFDFTAKLFGFALLGVAFLSIGHIWKGSGGEGFVLFLVMAFSVVFGLTCIYGHGYYDSGKLSKLIFGKKD